jgi:hypothetical protein
MLRRLSAAANFDEDVTWPAPRLPITDCEALNEFERRELACEMAMVKMNHDVRARIVPLF